VLGRKSAPPHLTCGPRDGTTECFYGRSSKESANALHKSLDFICKESVTVPARTAQHSWDPYPAGLAPPRGFGGDGA
jgi:hypothetical protein